MRDSYLNNLVIDKKWDQVHKFLDDVNSSRQISDDNPRTERIEVKSNIPIDIIKRLHEYGVLIKVINDINSISMELVKELVALGIEVELSATTNIIMNELKELSEAGAIIYYREMPLSKPRDFVERIRSMGIVIEWSNDPLIRSHPAINYFNNIHDNYHEVNEIVIDHGNIGSLSLIEYLKFMRLPFRIRGPVNYVTLSYRILVEEYENLSPEQLDDLFESCIVSRRCHYLRYMFDHRYQPDLSWLRDVNYLVIVILVECLDIEDEAKYQLWKQCIDQDRLNYPYFFHPTLHGFYLRYKEEYPDSPILPELIGAEDRLWNNGAVRLGSINFMEVRNNINEITPRIISNNPEIMMEVQDIIPDDLRREGFSGMVNNTYRNYCTNPVFSDLWSEVPSNNEEYLWFLHCNNIELPPIGNTYDGKIAIPHLLNGNHEEEILKLAQEGDILRLLQFLNISKFDIRPLLGKNEDLDLLISRMPKKSKNARNRVD